MSEEGEAELDAGQILETPQPVLDSSANPSLAREHDSSNRRDDPDGNADTKSVHSTSSSGRRMEYADRYGRRASEWSRAGGGEDDRARDEGYRYSESSEYYAKRDRSRSRSRSRDYGRRAAGSYGYYDSASVRRGESSYRGDDAEYSRSYSRGWRYGDSEYSSSGVGGRGYYRSSRHDRDSPRYRRRDPGRYPYPRSGYGAPRDELDEEEIARRNMDKERAIEELRSRVRARSDRPSGADQPPPDGKSPLPRSLGGCTGAEISSPAVKSPANVMSPQNQNTNEAEEPPGNPDAGSAGATAPAAAPAAPAAAATVAVTADIQNPDLQNPPETVAVKPIDPDDIEEGEHVEGEIDLESAAKDTYARERSRERARSRSYSQSPGRYARGDDPYNPRSRSRGRVERGRSRSRSKAYLGYDDKDSRKYRDYESSSGYRRRYDGYYNRRDYRSRGDSYSSRAGDYHSRYNDYQSRYNYPPSPKARDARESHDVRDARDIRDGGYRYERRYYGKYDRYNNGARSPSEADRLEAGTPSRKHSRSPIRSTSSGRRSRAEYATRHSYSGRPGNSRSRSGSRSPYWHSRDSRMADEQYRPVYDSERTRYGAGESKVPRTNPSSPAVGAQYTASPNAVQNSYSQDGSTNNPDSRNLPPPPPPPLASGGAGSRAIHTSSPTVPSTYQTFETPDRGYRSYSTRTSRHQTEYYDGGAASSATLDNRPSPSVQHGTNSRTPYNGSSRYGYEGHSRNSSYGGPHYQQQHHHQRAHSPGTMAQHTVPFGNAGNSSGSGGGTNAAVSHGFDGSGFMQLGTNPSSAVQAVSADGADLVISKSTNSAEWLESRAQSRSQAKKLLDASAVARKSGFELMYSDWNLQKVESQVQLAMWQLERAEQGLGPNVDSLIDPSNSEL